MRARRAEETAHRGRARGRSRSEAGLRHKQGGLGHKQRGLGHKQRGLGQKKGGLGEREALEEESSVGLGQSKGLEESQGGLGGEQGGGLGEIVRSPTSKTHRWPPDGQAAHTGLCRFPGRTPGPPGNQRCDPAGPATVTEMPGADPLGHRSFMESA